MDPLRVRTGDRVVAGAYLRLVLGLALYVRHAMQRKTVLTAAALDAALAPAVFVALGRESHDIDSGITWYLTVLWPFLLGWFAAAATLRLYAHVAESLAPARVDLGWRHRGLAMVSRAVVTGRSTPVAFVIVAYAFIGLLVFGWRLAVRGVTLLRRRA